MRLVPLSLSSPELSSLARPRTSLQSVTGQGTVVRPYNCQFLLLSIGPIPGLKPR